MDREQQKDRVAEHVAKKIPDGCLLGIGSGSTVHCFISHLAKRVQNGLSVRCVSSSLASEELGSSLGIPFISVNEVNSLDLTVDGADEITPQKEMIKGGGGALFREKLLAYHSKEVWIIVDSKKQVSALGAAPLPIEILPFFASGTVKKLRDLGFSGKFRGEENALFITDNGNLIFDITLDSVIDDPTLLHTQLIEIPGVLETGLFFELPCSLYSCSESGEISSS